MNPFENIILYLPILAVLVIIVGIVLWRSSDREKPKHSDENGADEQESNLDAPATEHHAPTPHVAPAAASHEHHEGGGHHSRILEAFLWFALIAVICAAGIGGWRWLNAPTKPYRATQIEALAQPEQTICPTLDDTSGETSCVFDKGYRIPVSLQGTQICGSGLLATLRSYYYVERENGPVLGPVAWTGSDEDRGRDKTLLIGEGSGSVTYRPCSS